MSENTAYISLDFLEDALIALLQRPNVQRAIIEAIAAAETRDDIWRKALEQVRKDAIDGATAAIIDLKSGRPGPGGF